MVECKVGFAASYDFLYGKNDSETDTLLTLTYSEKNKGCCYASLIFINHVNQKPIFFSIA